MTQTATSVSDRKQLLLDQLKKIQTRLDNIENQQAEKMKRLAKKYQLLELDDKILAQEFARIREKYILSVAADLNNNDIKKN